MTHWLEDKEVQNILGGKTPPTKILLSNHIAETLIQLPAKDRQAIIDYLVKIRPRTKLFRALGNENPYQTIEIDAKNYRLLEVFKHDSWAATAIYGNEDNKIVCKFNRQQPILGVPMSWLGRRLAQRENKFLKMFNGFPFFPSYSGEVKVNGVALPYASAHHYIEGTPLKRYEYKVSDDFFPQLQNALKCLHARQISYMDLNKQENIIVTEQGKPVLIDFQICFHLPQWWPGNSKPMRYLLRLLQQSDNYHLMKHYSRLRPDLFTPTELKRVQKRPWFINFYRCIQTPLRGLRRKLLFWLGYRNRSGKVTSEAFVEHGLRKNDHATLIPIANHQLCLKYHDGAVEITAIY